MNVRGGTDAVAVGDFDDLGKVGGWRGEADLVVLLTMDSYSVL